MAVQDIIIRRGSRHKEVKVGPTFLFGPTSDRRHRVGSDIDRITGDVDLYEISNSPCGVFGGGITPPGEYMWFIEPFQERGFKRYIRAIRNVAVIKLRESDGKSELLFRKSVPATDRKFAICAPGGAPFEVTTGERLFLSIERLGGTSNIQYKLSLDAITRVVKAEPKVSKPAKVKEPAPMVEATEEDKAWDLVQKPALED